MRPAKHGHIVNVTSIGGLVGQPMNEIYCGAKFAVEGFTEALATYLTPGFNIKFTCVEPGGISSDFAKTVMSEVGKGPDIGEEYKELQGRYMTQIRARSTTGGVYQTPLEVATVIANKVIDNDAPSLPFRIRTSSWSENVCRFKTGADPTGDLQRTEQSLPTKPTS